MIRYIYKFADLKKLDFCKTAKTLGLIICFFSISFFVASCSGEDFDDVVEKPSDENVNQTDYFFSIDFQMSDDYKSRSTTEPDGSSSDDPKIKVSDYTYPYEYKLNDAVLYFFEQTVVDANTGETTGGDYLCHFFFPQNSNYIKLNYDNIYTLSARIDIKDVLKLMGKKVNVYIIANIGEDLGKIENESSLMDRERKITTQSLTGIYGFMFTGGFPDDLLISNEYGYTLDLTRFKIEGEDLNDAKLITLVNNLFKGTIKINDNIWKRWDISSEIEVKEGTEFLYKGPGVMPLERTLARLDLFIDESKMKNLYGVDYVLYHLDGATRIVDEEGDIDFNDDIYLRLDYIKMFNVSKETYIYRHVSEGNNTDGLTDDGKIYVFGNERGDSYDNTDPSSVYNWIYDSDWNFITGKLADKPRLTEDGVCLLNQGIYHNQPEYVNGKWTIDDSIYQSWPFIYSIRGVVKNRGYKGDYIPLFYMPENTVPSTSHMNLAFNTGIVFRFLLCDKDGDVIGVRKQNGKMIGQKDPNKVFEPGYEPHVLKLYMSDGSYQEVKQEESRLGSSSSTGYELIYKYLIEHNRNGNKVNSGSGVASDLLPMQIGVVRNNIYQLKINSIKGLPEPHEPDNYYLDIDLKVLAWAKHDIHVTF